MTHGIKRNMSSQYENKSCKITKIKHFVSNNQPTNVNTPTQTNEEIATTHTVARATQIWPPCKITRDSQTMLVFLYCTNIYYNIIINEIINI